VAQKSHTKGSKKVTSFFHLHFPHACLRCRWNLQSEKLKLNCEQESKRCYKPVCFSSNQKWRIPSTSSSPTPPRSPDSPSGLSFSSFRQRKNFRFVSLFSAISRVQYPNPKLKLDIQSCHRFRLMKQDDNFWVNFDLF